MSRDIIVSPLRSVLQNENAGTPAIVSPQLDAHCLPQAKVQNTPSTDTKPVNELVAKYKCILTSERLMQLRKMVEEAVKDHRIFTVRGGWHTLRLAFIRRNWVEKFEIGNKKACTPNPSSSLEELCLNLPAKQTWETQAAHVMKCERTIMSRLLQMHDVDFYWNSRRDNHDMHFRLSCNKLMSRFSRSLFTSKEGLCLLLQQMHWHIEPGLANVNFPRCYVLGFPDHFNNFLDDYRLTACTSLLKFVIEVFQKQDQYALQSPEGTVPYSAFQFALDRINEFIASKKHMDIDVDIPEVDAASWDTFHDHFMMIVHGNQLFLENKSYVLVVLIAAAKTAIRKLHPYLPQINLDGMKNIWILKPGNKCRGRGIQLIKDVKDVAKVMDAKVKYVVQKYIERPLIIYNTKFDIRQWFLITSVQPLVIWMYSSQNFSLDNFHESLHLTNHAVQCKYKNYLDRDKALPDDNMWDCYTFQSYLKNLGYGNKWETVIYPGMRESIIGAMLTCQDTMDRRPNTFEIYGADFIIAEDFKPWLLEINSSPDLSSSTSVTARMCPQCLEDLVKVVIDKRRDSSSDTGLFDLIFKQNFPRPPAYLGMNLTIRGRRIFKRLRSRKDKENEDIVTKHTPTISRRTPKAATHDSIPGNLELNDEVEHIYKGPIIADLMEEIQQFSCDSDTNNEIESVQPLKVVASRSRSKPKKVSELRTRPTRGSPGCNHIARKISPNPLQRKATSSPRTAPHLLQSSPPGSRRPSASAPKRRIFKWDSVNPINDIMPRLHNAGINAALSVLTAKHSNSNTKLNKVGHTEDVVAKPQLQVPSDKHQCLLQQLRQLQLQHEVHQRNVNQLSTSYDRNKLLTIGRGLGKLIPPTT